MPSTTPPFAHQRIIYLALLLGMTMFAILGGVALEMNEGKGIAEQPIDILEVIVVPVALGIAAFGMILRSLLLRHASGLEGDSRLVATFRARLISLAMLEFSVLFSITVWILNGNRVPSLAIAMVILAIAIVITPFRDPDAQN